MQFAVHSSLASLMTRTCGSDVGQAFVETTWREGSRPHKAKACQIRERSSSTRAVALL